MCFCSLTAFSCEGIDAQTDGDFKTKPLAIPNCCNLESLRSLMTMTPESEIQAKCFSLTRAKNAAKFCRKHLLIFVLEFPGRSATKMTGRPGHWSEPGEYNILFLGSVLVISSQDSSALGYREFTQEGAMTTSPFAAREGTSAPQWPIVKKCCRHLVPSSDFFVQSYAVPRRVAARDFTKNPPHIPRGTKQNSFTARFWEWQGPTIARRGRGTRKGALAS